MCESTSRRLTTFVQQALDKLKSQQIGAKLETRIDVTYIKVDRGWSERK